MENYVTDEGHIIDWEDIQTYVKWKIKELMAEEWNDKRILSFDDSKMWKSTAAKYIATLE